MFCQKRQGEGRSGEVAQATYTHVSKCKNDKIKEREKNIAFLSYCVEFRGKLIPNQKGEY
jgi:hypothetical protein